LPLDHGCPSILSPIAAGGQEFRITATGGQKTPVYMLRPGPHTAGRSNHALAVIGLTACRIVGSMPGWLRVWLVRRGKAIELLEFQSTANMPILFGRRQVGSQSLEDNERGRQSWSEIHEALES
jgi:hypothetical protein